MSDKKGKWLGPNLDNYKEMHKDKHPEVMKAKTVTEARKICFGEKPKRAMAREEAFNDWKDKNCSGPCPLKNYTKDGR